MISLLHCETHIWSKLLALTKTNLHPELGLFHLLLKLLALLLPLIHRIPEGCKGQIKSKSRSPDDSPHFLDLSLLGLDLLLELCPLLGLHRLRVLLLLKQLLQLVLLPLKLLSGGLNLEVFVNTMKQFRLEPSKFEGQVELDCNPE